MSFSGKRILVTGGAGFIGSHLAHRLVADGADVHLFVRKDSAITALGDVMENLTLHTITLDDHEAVESALAALSPNGVFHLAAVNQSYVERPTLEQLFRGNAENAINLMEAAAKLPLDFFVNTTSFAEVGPKDAPLKEDDSFEPMECYGISRVPATLYAHALGKYQAKPFVTVRVFTPYGSFVRKGSLIYKVITTALAEGDITLTRADVTRDFIYVDDLVDLYVGVAENARTFPGQLFNAGSGIATTLEAFVQAVLKCTGSTSTVSWSEKEVPYDRARWQADISKTVSVLSWKPAHTLSEGIEETVAWFRTHPEYYEALR